MPVGFFTHGVKYTLPHPKIRQRTVLLICKVIKRAWQLLGEKPASGFHIRSADEDTITQVLVEIIENSLRKSGDVDGFNCTLFGRVIRDPKITNFDKRHPDKMPDIFFDLRGSTCLSSAIRMASLWNASRWILNTPFCPTIAIRDWYVSLMVIMPGPCKQHRRRQTSTVVVAKSFDRSPPPPTPPQPKPSQSQASITTRPRSPF